MGALRSDHFKQLISLTDWPSPKYVSMGYFMSVGSCLLLSFG
jgi:hypothetical protein